METCHIALEKDIYDKWCSIRAVMGLASDTQIAKVLLQQVSEGLSPLCSQCHCQLSLFCTRCKCLSPAQPVAQTLDNFTSTDQQPAPASGQQSDSTELSIYVKEELCSATEHSCLDWNKVTDDENSQESSLKVVFENHVGLTQGKDMTSALTVSDGTSNRLKSQEDGTSLLCTECTDSSTNQDSLSQNRQTARNLSSPQTAFFCGKCADTFTTEKDLASHAKTQHCDENFPICDKCCAIFSSETSLKKHVCRHITKKLTVCSRCGVSFTSLFLFRRHMKSHGVKSPFTCDKCKAAFMTNTKLQKHQCPKQQRVDGVHFSNSNNKKKKEKRHSRGRPKKEKPTEFCCSDCGKIFCHKGSLWRHTITIHTAQGDRPHVCTECGLGFVTKYELETHKKKHTGEKTYFCEFCTAAFTERWRLKRHKNIHAEDREVFICEVCGSSFSDRSCLKSHMRIHSDERPYKCSECGLAFRQTCTLRKHERKHKGDRKFVCSECGRAFTEREYWRSHMRTHTGERPFVCDICGAGFAQKGSLNSHRKTHNPVQQVNNLHS